MAKIGSVLAAFFLMFVIGVSACGTPQPTVEQEKYTVTVGDIVQRVSADGTLSLPRDRKLSFGTSGKIEQVNVVEGDRVRKGAVLARLEMAPLERAVAISEMAISAAEADSQQAELAIKTAEADSKQLGDNLRSAAIDVELAADNYRKITYPYTFSTFAFDVPAALDEISRAERQVKEAQATLQTAATPEEIGKATRQLDEALDSLTTARERLARGVGQDVFANQLLPVRDFWTLRAAQLQVDKAQVAAENARTLFAKSQVGIDSARVAAGKAKLAVDRARQDAATAREMLDKAVITAPFDGVIADVDVKPGDSFTTVDFTRTVIHIVDPSHMELAVDVDEIDVPGVKPGQEATITLDALPGRQLSGKVTFISPLSKVVAGVVLYEVKMSLDTPESMGLRAGMSATASIVTDRRNDVLFVPSRTIAQDPSGGSTVKVLVGAQVEERPVVTGISDDFNTEIVSGLKEGETVVIERQVKPGTGGMFG